MELSQCPHVWRRSQVRRWFAGIGSWVVFGHLQKGSSGRGTVFTCPPTACCRLKGRSLKRPLPYSGITGQYCARSRTRVRIWAQPRTCPPSQFCPRLCRVPRPLRSHRNALTPPSHWRMTTALRIGNRGSGGKHVQGGVAGTIQCVLGRPSQISSRPDLHHLSALFGSREQAFPLLRDNHSTPHPLD